MSVCGAVRSAGLAAHQAVHQAVGPAARPRPPASAAAPAPPPGSAIDLSRGPATPASPTRREDDEPPRPAVDFAVHGLVRDRADRAAVGGPGRGARMTSMASSPMTPESLSTDCSLVDELDLDLWEGQFEFVGPDFNKDDEEDAEHADDVITPAMVRRARAERSRLDDLNADGEAQQWCDHLSDQVQMLQQQVGVLADNQTSTDERYTRAKQDNAALQARVLMLEEQLRETELRADERLQDEQKRHREIMVRVEREKQLELENFAIRLQTAELEVQTLRDEAGRLRAQTDHLRTEKLRVQEALVDAEAALAALRDEADQQRDGLRQREAEHQQREQLVEELSLEMERLREREAALRQSARAHEPDQAAQVLALGAQLERVRDEARQLREANEELQALVLTRGVEEGRSLLGSASLAAELEAMSQDEIRQALKEQQEMNAQLRQYIDGILINIIENYPELLEVRKP